MAGWLVGKASQAGIGRKPGVDALDWYRPCDQRLNDEDSAELTLRITGEPGNSPVWFAGSSTGTSEPLYIGLKNGADCEGSCEA